MQTHLLKTLLKISQVQSFALAAEHLNMTLSAVSMPDLSTTPEMAREARNEMDHFVIKGRELEVVFAQERRKTPNEMRGRVVGGRDRGRMRGRDDRGDGRNFER